MNSATIVLWYSDPKPKVSAVSFKDLRPLNGETIQEKAKCEGKYMNIWYPCLVVHLDKERSKGELERQLLTGKGKADYLTLGNRYLREMEEISGKILPLVTQSAALDNTVTQQIASSTSYAGFSSNSQYAVPNAPHQELLSLQSQQVQQGPVQGGGLYGHFPSPSIFGNYVPHPMSLYTQQQVNPQMATGNYGHSQYPHLGTTVQTDGMAAPGGNQTNARESLMKAEIDRLDERVKDLEENFGNLTERMKKVELLSAGSASFKDPVLVAVLSKPHVSFAVREAMRHLLTKQEMMESVLNEKNIKHSKVASRVVEAATLEKVRVLTDSYIAEKKLHSITSQEFREIVGQYLQEIKSIETRKKKRGNDGVDISGYENLT